ncbi:MAG: hypothetical protein R3E83_22080 [Burkholderiaceae bacterium]
MALADWCDQAGILDLVDVEPVHVAAGIDTEICCHAFRTTGITA